MTVNDRLKSQPQNSVRETVKFDDKTTQYKGTYHGLSISAGMRDINRSLIPANMADMRDISKALIQAISGGIGLMSIS